MKEKNTRWGNLFGCFPKVKNLKLQFDFCLQWNEMRNVSAGWHRLMERKSGNINFRFRWFWVSVCVCEEGSEEWGAHVVLPVLLNGAINFTDVMASTTTNSRHLQVREREWEKWQRERAVTLCQQTSFNMLSTWPRTLLPVALTQTRTRAQSETRYRYCSLAPALFTLLWAVSVWNECEYACVRDCECVCMCVFTHTPTSAKYSVAINSLCYRWLRCGAVMFLLLSIKCKPKWQLELSTRHSTALYLQKVNSRVATAITVSVVVVAGACVTMQFRARLVMCCQRKCQLKLPFVNNGLAPQRCPRSAQRGADDSSRTHTQTYVLVLHVCTCVCNVRAKWTLPIGGNWFIPETKGLS